MSDYLLQDWTYQDKTLHKLSPPRPPLTPLFKVTSVTRYRYKKKPNFFQKLPKYYPQHFFLKSAVFQNSPKGLQVFPLLMQENLLPKTFKNVPIWSH